MEKDNRINLLPSELAHKIAAGEVIERPASVVKELIENSIDAHASKIEIEIKQAGKALIRVKDNGIGIHPNDLEKAFMRYATSKISTIKDLFRIQSLGFRGEALHSISAVSKLTLRSKTRDLPAWEIKVHGNKIISKQPTNLFIGTEIKVLNLFFNTPARLKFLKSDKTENRHIIKTILPYCLLFSDKDINLKIEGKNIFQNLPCEIENRIQKLLGLDPNEFILTDNIVFKKNLTAKFLLGNSTIRRARRDAQFIFINNRPISFPKLQTVINRIYRCIIPEGYYPAFIIFLKLDPQDIDVNIHPTKKEIRLKDEGPIIKTLSSFIRNKLLSNAKIVQVSFCPSKLNNPTPKLDNKTIFGATLNRQHKHPEENIIKPQLPIKHIIRHARIIGTFMNKYGLLEYNETLYLIDVHAAQERINYETLLNQIKSNKIDIQNLIYPLTLELSLEELYIFQEIKNLLEDMGFNLSSWGNNTIAIHSHPSIIKNPISAIREILSEKYAIQKISEVKNTLIRKACRSSLMAGDNITIENLKQLCLQLLKCDNPNTCPHGRPTIIGITDNDLERIFLRKK